MFMLPSPRLLQKVKNAVDQRPGFQQQNLEGMAKAGEDQKVPSHGYRGLQCINDVTSNDYILYMYHMFKCVTTLFGNIGANVFKIIKSLLQKKTQWSNCHIHQGSTFSTLGTPKGYLPHYQ